MSERLRTDVLIVGAGPGGSAAALTLARQGVQCLLVDRSAFPRDKTCGDALSGKVVRTLERIAPELLPQLRSSADQLPSWGVSFTAPNGKRLRVPFSREVGRGEAPGAIMPRLHFDDLLFRAASRAEGIRTLSGVDLKHYERTRDGWEVRDRTGQKNIDTRLVIAADGANSHFARHVAGLEMDPLHHCAGVRGYYKGVEGLDQQGFIELIFLKELLPGYLWIFPLPNGMANVGLGLRSDVVAHRRVDLKKLLRSLLEEHPDLKSRFVGSELIGGIQGMGLPLASKRQALSGSGHMLVGDAGHLIDPFTGEGISHAMISGMHAGNVAAEFLRGEQKDLSDYDVRVWKRLGKELAISTRLQRLAARPWLFDLVVNKAVRNPTLADVISSMFTDLDMRERLKQPSFYLRILFG